MQLKKRLSLYSCLGIILFFFGLRIGPHLQTTKPFSFEDTYQYYTLSQYSPLLKARALIIQDWDLYPIAGVVYLSSGDLTKINPEHPPLGKYLLGLSALFTPSAITIQIILSLGMVASLFVLADAFFANRKLALLVTLMFMTESLFVFNTTYALLDQLLVTLLVLFFVVLKKYPRSLSKSIVLGLILGGIAATKFPMIAIIIFISYILVGLFSNMSNLRAFLLPSLAKKGRHFAKAMVGAQQAASRGGLKVTKEEIKPWLLMFGVASLVYIVSYAPLITTDGLDGFINIHIQAASIHLAHVPEYPWFAPSKVMLFNQWPVWFDSAQPLHSVPEWNWRWPILWLTLVASPLLVLKNFKAYRSLLPLLVFMWIYFIFLNSRLFFPNYLYPLLPFGYLILGVVLKQNGR